MAPKQQITITLDPSIKCVAFDLIAAVSGVEYLLAIGLKRTLQKQDGRITLGEGLAWADLARGRDRLWKGFRKELKISLEGKIDEATRSEAKQLMKEHRRLGHVRDELAHGVFLASNDGTTKLVSSYARQGKTPPPNIDTNIDLPAAARDAKALFKAVHQFLSQHLPV